MSKQARISFWFVLSMVAIAALTTALEYSLIAPPDRPVYLGARIFLFSLSVPLILLFRKKPYSEFAHFCLGLLVVTYTSHGQWYRPFYEYTFFQSLIFYTLLLYPSRRVFYSVLAIGSVIFSTVYILRFDAVVLNSKTTLEENYMGLLAFVLTLVGVFKVFSEQRAFKEQALARFGYLGKHSAAILHDLKTTVAIPRIYTELAEKELEKGDIDSARHRLQETLSSLESMQNIILRLNQMSQLTNFKNDQVDLREIVEEVRSVLRMKVQNIQFAVAGEATVETSRSFAFSFVLNILMNSFEVFSARRIVDPKVDILLDGNRLIYTDNGGGFDSQVLHKIESGVSASTKVEASGLGLFLLIEGIRNMGGKIQCSNTREGARIEVQFKK